MEHARHVAQLEVGNPRRVLIMKFGGHGSHENRFDSTARTDVVATDSDSYALTGLRIARSHLCHPGCWS